ncbi:MAG: hypothetical protein ACO1NW_18685 [Chitinophagaceae bacterium]
MKRIFLLLTLMLTCNFLFAQQVPTLMTKGEEYEAALNEQAALKTYQQALRIQPTYIPALVKCSELCSRIGFRQERSEARNDYYRAGKKYAELALKLDPRAADAHVAMAIALGRMAMVASAKEKVAAVKEIKAHAEQALEADPSNFKAFHVLGKWHFEVWNLNSVERTAVKLFYGGFPKASLQEAITYFEKARTLQPKFLLNYLELAKAYDKNNERKKAIQVLEAMLQYKNLTEDDSNAKQEAGTLLKKWK